MIAAFMVPQKRDFISRDDAKIAAWTILEGIGVSAKHNEMLEYGWECSICGRWEMDKEPFCNCGADMREES